MKIVKKITLIALGLGFFEMYGRTATSSQTFMFVHPVFQNLALDKALWHTALFDKEKRTAVQVTSFYQKAFDADHINQFFLPSAKDRVRVNMSESTRDILPVWLGLPSSFDGYATFAPTYHSCGCRIEARRMIGDLLPLPFLKNFWLSASIPFVVTKQNLNLGQESVENAAATTNTVYDILTAFKNPDWNYGKIDVRDAKKTIPEIRFGYGSTIFSRGQAYAVTYSSLSIPLHKPQPNEYLFDNQIGHNGHIGLMWGLSMQLPINNETDSYQVNLHADLENTFLFQGHEYRTFDLYGKEWSRYLLFREKDQVLDVTIPGVNVLTQKVMVDPHHTVDLAAGIRVNAKSLEFDFGYGLWGHGGDRITFTQTWHEKYGIAGSLANTTASESTATTIGSDDITFTPVKLKDLDITSAQMPGVVVHKLFASCGYARRGEKYDLTLGGGGFMEMPHQREKAFSIWGIHVKGGVGF